MVTDDASNGPTTNATRYVDMTTVGENAISRRPSPSERDDASLVLENAARFSGIARVT